MPEPLRPQTETETENISKLARHLVSTSGRGAPMNQSDSSIPTSVLEFQDNQAFGRSQQAGPSYQSTQFTSDGHYGSQQTHRGASSHGYPAPPQRPNPSHPGASNSHPSRAPYPTPPPGQPTAHPSERCPPTLSHMQQRVPPLASGSMQYANPAYPHPHTPPPVLTSPQVSEGRSQGVAAAPQYYEPRNNLQQRASTSLQPIVPIHLQMQASRSLAALSPSLSSPHDRLNIANRHPPSYGHAAPAPTGPPNTAPPPASAPRTHASARHPPPHPQSQPQSQTNHRPARFPTPASPAQHPHPHPHTQPPPPSTTVLAACNAGLAAQVRALEDALAHSHAAHAEALACGHRLAAERDRLRGERDRLRGERDQLHSERDQLRGEREGLRAEYERVRGGYELVREEYERVCGQLQLARARGKAAGEARDLEGREGREHMRLREREIAGLREEVARLAGERDALALRARGDGVQAQPTPPLDPPAPDADIDPKAEPLDDLALGLGLELQYPPETPEPEPEPEPAPPAPDPSAPTYYAWDPPARPRKRPRATYEAPSRSRSSSSSPGPSLGPACPVLRAVDLDVNSPLGYYHLQVRLRGGGGGG
ncbi:hypothetical protein B0H15DRAFT_88871 [Mycena belliarum]|uniref:Uncharacterized protein n=1 Tax=Mycena belliarum TaxID=1033014 RepID=A0AAD6TS70_9AGAR|nr:hypothetical protein B0H15DRAFT_88871 [Mycena belliae]